jgi:hypothetical protein
LALGRSKGRRSVLLRLRRSVLLRLRRSVLLRLWRWRDITLFLNNIFRSMSPYCNVEVLIGCWDVRRRVGGLC